MHEELVERRRWISEEHFLHALNFCMLLPGPEAQQLATYIGWRLHGTRGGVVAGGLFVLPSAVILWVLSYAYVTYGGLPVATSLLGGLKLAVLAIVAAAAVRIGRKVIKSAAMAALAVVAFVAIYFGEVPFPLLIIGAGLVGYFGVHWQPHNFTVLKSKVPVGVEDISIMKPARTERGDGSWRGSVRTAVIGGLLWGLPLLAVGLCFGWKHTLFAQGVFFSKAAVVTFGGAYAVLPYVAQQAVEHYGWLAPGQMLDGLGLAETTPGPLIMVLQFVGFVGAWQHPQGVPPIIAATLGAMLTTWVTFVPCFLWIFLGAPHVDRLYGNERLTAALSAMTAAVVGVIASLALHFGMEVLRPAHLPLDWLGLMLVVLGFVGLAHWKWGVVPVIAAGVVCGLARHYSGW